MNYAMPIPVLQVFTKNRHSLIFGLYAVVACFSLQGYLDWRSPVFILGLLSFFLVIRVNKQQPGSTRYAYATLAACLVSLLIPVKTGFYMALCCAVMFAIESLWGKMNVLPVVVLALMSPFFQYFSNVFTFPIRLRLTSWSGEILQLVGTKAAIEGNMIVQNGDEFSVDPACMGLNMMTTSLILGLVMIALCQKQLQKQVPVWLPLLILSTIAVLNIVSNLLRIVLTVQFKIMPQTWMHDFMGIVCLIGYVILPSLWLCKKMIACFGKRHREQVPDGVRPQKTAMTVFSFLIPVFILLSSFSVIHHNNASAKDGKKIPSVAGYTSQRVDPSIIKLENAVSLVYLKKIPGFYAADHTPLICWRGSGYEFRKIKELSLQHTKIYSGVLQKGNEQLYTVWWYENGQHITINQLEWRWDVVKGNKPYSVVNITASSEQQVREEAERVLTIRPFQALVQ